MLTRSARMLRNGPRSAAVQFSCSASGQDREIGQRKIGVTGQIVITRIAFSVEGGAVLLHWGVNGDHIAVLSGKGVLDYSRYGGPVGASSIHATTIGFERGSAYTVTVEAVKRQGATIDANPDWSRPTSFSGGAGRPSPIYVGEGTLQGSVNALSYSPFPTFAPGDVGLMLVETDNEAVTLAGWTELTAYGAGTPGVLDATRLTAFWKRLEAGDTAPVTSDSGDHTIGRLVIVRNCSNVRILGGVADSVAASPATFEAATTSTVNTLVLHVLTAASDESAAHTSAWSSPTLAGQVAEQFDGGATTGNGGSISAYSGVQAAPGSLGSVTVATSRTLPMNMARVTFAFEP